MMVKILKIVEVKAKIREKELLEMDKPDHEEDMDSEQEEQKTKKKIKEIAKKDTFFTEQEEELKPTDKKVVQRNGWIIDPKKQGGTRVTEQERQKK